MKKIPFIMLMLFLTVSFVQANEIIMHYAFDGDLTDSSAQANVASWKDSSLAEYDTIAPAVGTAAIVFGGNDPNFPADPNSYVDLGINSVPNPDNNIRSEGSASFWVKTQSTSPMAVCGTFNKNDSSGFQILINDGVTGKIVFFLRSANGSRTAISATATDVLDGQWHHIVAVWNYVASKKASLYVDGQSLTLTESTVLTPSPLTAWEYPLTLGARNNRGNIDNYFIGELDNFKLFTSALSQENVNTEYSENWICDDGLTLDKNGDCYVDIADFVIFSDAWLNCGRYPESECN